VTYHINKPKNGGTAFTCEFCAHSVNTLDFNTTNGNRRTQAANVLNRHTALLHPGPSSLEVALRRCPEPGDRDVRGPVSPLRGPSLSYVQDIHSKRVLVEDPLLETSACIPQTGTLRLLRDHRTMLDAKDKEDLLRIAKGHQNAAKPSDLSWRG
jgi:hypothetical protein